MFLETFYDGGENVEEYACDDDCPRSDMEQDPLRAGAAGDKAILDPRRYFLDTLAIRIKRVNGEWRHVRDIINLEIKAAVSLWFFWGGFFPCLGLSLRARS